MFKPMVMEQGVRFHLREGKQTMATGVVTKVLPDFTLDERAKFEKGRTRKEKDALAAKLQEIQEAFSRTNQ